MNILISGGCKNGKSGFAQKIALKLSDGETHYYVATMIPFDDEDRNRIAMHVLDRANMGFKTLEVKKNIASCLEKSDLNGTFLIDSITALLLNEMFASHKEEYNIKAADRCIRGLNEITRKAKNAIFVTDYIYSDAEKYEEFTETYRASLAKVDRFLAKRCDVVIELCAGNVIFHKGRLNI